MIQPELLSIPFARDAASGTKNNIPNDPNPSLPSQSATWSFGFPAITMQPLAVGGLPPLGQDFNGVLNALSEHTVYQNAGGMYKFSAELAAAIGGYSKGAVLISDDGAVLYASMVDGNTTNFNSNPSSIGVLWRTLSGNQTPVGVVEMFAGSSLPYGYLWADGTAVGRVEYAKLFASIGTAWGSGNGSTTFNLPDLRGEFVRGLDRNRGIDPGRTLGSRQKGSLSTIDSTVDEYTATGLYNSETPESGAAQRYGMDNPAISDYPNAKYVGVPSDGSPASISAEPNNFGVTRPRNVAVNYIVKAF